jgi:hypothetical protein
MKEKMPEGDGGGTKGIGGILKAQTGPLPNWAWIVVIVGGLAAAYIIPKFLGAKGSTSQTSTDTGTGNSGLGLAIDPTSGLPYAVEGLVPSGGTVSTQSGVLPPTPTTPATDTTTTVDESQNPFYPLLAPGTTDVPSATGSYYQVNGQWYTIVAGEQGRIWGALGKLSAQQAQNTPISATTKRLLIAPPNNYTPAWPGNTTQTRVGAT